MALAKKAKTKGRSYAVEDTQRLVTAEIEMSLFVYPIKY
jgi:hypothetical protein